MGTGKESNMGRLKHGEYSQGPDKSTLHEGSSSPPNVQSFQQNQITEAPKQKLQRAHNVLLLFFYELSRFNFEKCERMLDQNPAKTSLMKKTSSGMPHRPGGATSPMHRLNNLFGGAQGSSMTKKDISMNIIEEDMMKNV